MTVLTVKLDVQEGYKLIFERVDGFDLDDCFHSFGGDFKLFLKKKIPGFNTEAIDIKSWVKCFYAKEQEKGDDFYSRASILSITFPQAAMDMVSVICLMDEFLFKTSYSSIRLGDELVSTHLIKAKRDLTDETDPSYKAPFTYMLKRLLHLSHEKTNHELILGNQCSIALGGGPHPDTVDHLPMPLNHFKTELSCKNSEPFLIRNFILQTLIKNQHDVPVLKALCDSVDTIFNISEFQNPDALPRLSNNSSVFFEKKKMDEIQQDNNEHSSSCDIARTSL